MDGKEASGGRGDGDSFCFVAISEDELVMVERWERKIDENRDTAEHLFWGELIRTAKADYKLQDEADRSREARSFEPRQQPPANKLSSPPPPPPPPPPQTEFSRITVLALCAPDLDAPKKSTRKPPAARAPQGKKPRIAPRGGAGKKSPELDHPHGRSLVQPRQPSTTSKPDQAPARPQNSTETVTAPRAAPHPGREAEWAPSSSTAGAPQGKIQAS